MEVTVLLFGPPAAIAGTDRLTIRLSADHSVAALSAALAACYPTLCPALAAGRFAINHAFALPATIIKPADEVALISMVSGG